MEEIDIIELLQRVKEGKAPKLIEIENEKYSFFENYAMLEEIYEYIEQDNFWCIDTIELDTKIKILDKPIIEEIPLIEIKHDYSNGSTNDTYEVERAITNEELAKKINEIIKHINKEEK